MTAKLGEPAPKFQATAYVDGKFVKVGLDDYKGKWVVLFFYPRDFTFVCPTEIKGFAIFEKEFKALGAAVIGASTDSEYCHKAWYEKELPMVKFPVLADTNHQISADYGVLVEKDGLALRGTFIIDPAGIIQYIVIANTNVGRSINETLRTLSALKSGGLCPMEWKPGEKTLGKA
jgi:peroxiredoxin (alkyl hydroperoxide reductase subunit C)